MEQLVYHLVENEKVKMKKEKLNEEFMNITNE